MATDLTLHIIRRRPPTDTVASAITPTEVARLFSKAAGRKPLPATCVYEEIANILNRPWREGHKHGGPWHLRSAIRVILDDAPRMGRKAQRCKTAR